MRGASVCEYVVVSHTAAVLSPPCCTRRRRNPNEKNQKEKSVSSAICLRHSFIVRGPDRGRSLPLGCCCWFFWACYSSAAPGRRKMLFLRRHRWKFHEFSHPKSDNFLLFHFLRPVPYSAKASPKPKEKEHSFSHVKERKKKSVGKDETFHNLLFSSVFH